MKSAEPERSRTVGCAALQNASIGRDRIRSLPFSSFPAGDGMVIMHSCWSGRRTILEAPMVPVLQECAKFRIFEEQVKTVSEAGLPGDLLRAHYDILISTGFLVSEDAALPQTPPREGDSCQIEFLAIPCCERPQYLARALDSYSAHIARFGRRVRILVSDDSHHKEASQISRNVAQQTANTCGHIVLYSDREDRERHIRSLSQTAKIPEEALRFGLLGGDFEGPAIGGNRNWMLLQSAGEALLSVDEDTVCKIGLAPGCGREGAAISGEQFPTESWSYPDKDRCFADLQPIEIDPLAAHERMLGRSVVDWATSIRDAVGAVDVSQACDHLLMDLLRSKARFSVTLNGIAGDSGMYSGVGFLLQERPNTRQRLLESSQSLSQSLSSRYVISQVPLATVAHHAPFHSMFMAIDNRDLVPPFFPLYRNEDSIFQACLNQCIPDGYVGNIPFCMVHDPGDGRLYSADRWAAIRVADAVLTCLALCKVEGGSPDPADRQRMLAQRLIFLASRSAADFAAELRNGLWLRAAAILQLHERLLSVFCGKPDFWAAELDHERRRLRDALLRDDYFVPTDLTPRCRHPSDAMSMLQRLLLRFGEFLWWWPEIVNAAKTARSRGEL